MGSLRIQGPVERVELVTTFFDTTTACVLVLWPSPSQVELLTIRSVGDRVYGARGLELLAALPWAQRLEIDDAPHPAYLAPFTARFHAALGAFLDALPPPDS